MSGAIDGRPGMTVPVTDAHVMRCVLEAARKAVTE